jgi:hypothetical protein
MVTRSAPTRYVRTVRRLVSGSRTADEAPACDSPGTMLDRSLALTRKMRREYPISQVELRQLTRLVARIALTLLVSS